ncbi:hypothetical protein VQ7734_03065 [Vibrio quintilis]|uniref:Uncharacterized protein n=1 Tax=Vibrio quintilis TaxID=1117707 RepID=A0A1M7YXU6_9VIBR|nr:hypothetical protein VQ7734_03065 [Vibrio quintilis]
METFLIKCLEKMWILIKAKGNQFNNTHKRFYLNFHKIKILLIFIHLIRKYFDN